MYLYFFIIIFFILFDSPSNAFKYRNSSIDSYILLIWSNLILFVERKLWRHSATWLSWHFDVLHRNHFQPLLGANELRNPKMITATFHQIVLLFFKKINTILEIRHLRVLLTRPRRPSVVLGKLYITRIGVNFSLGILLQTSECDWTGRLGRVRRNPRQCISGRPREILILKIRRSTFVNSVEEHEQKKKK